MILVPVALFALGLLVIAKGGGWFADGAVGVAAKTGVPKIVIGATLMSMATTLPEFTVSFIASLEGNSATAVGNAIGSTICNVGLILAIAVLIHPLKQAKIDLGPLIVALTALLLVGFLASDYLITRVDAVVLLVLLAAFLSWQLRRILAMRRSGSAHNQDDAVDSLAQMPIKRSLGLFAVGAVATVLGSRLVVANGIELARAMGVSELVIGLTLVSIGTSLPEFVASVTAARRGYTDLATGNILGANLFNLAWVLPGAALVRELPLDPQMLRIDLPVSLLLMASVGLGLVRGSLRRGWGIAALVVYSGYLVYLFTA